MLAKYQEDFYAEMPAVTCNTYGKGKAYYIAFRDTGDFLEDFYGKLIHDTNLQREIKSKLPYGVTAHTREDEENVYLFIENYNSDPRDIELMHTYINELTGEQVSGKQELNGYQTLILRRNKRT